MILHISTLRMARKIAKAFYKIYQEEFFKGSVEIASAIQEWHKEWHKEFKDGTGA